MATYSPTIWLHAGDDESAAVLLSVLSRLADDGMDFDIVISATQRHTVDDLNKTGRTRGAETVWYDTSYQYQDLVRARKPALIIWFGGGFDGPMATIMETTKAPALLVNADQADVAPKGLIRRVLVNRSFFKRFNKIFACDGSTRARLERAGVDPARITVTGPLMEEIETPPHNPHELTVMAECVGNRPNWLAVNAELSELPHLIHAHRTASRRGHRLQLLVAPSDPDKGVEFTDRLKRSGFATGCRSAGDEPQDHYQAYVVDQPEEIGVWYRLAQLTYMGGTLEGPGGASPFAPASVGSAVLHGPITTPWEGHYERLAAVGACRKVRTGKELGTTLGELISPERSATMAQAGWEELTQSAEHMNVLTDLIEEMMFDAEVA